MATKNILEYTEEINKLKQEIAGEIVISPSVAGSLKKWQNIFETTQRTVAREMKISSSTLSDYENDRRQNPHISFVKKFVDALVNIDARYNCQILKKLITIQQAQPFETKEFKKGIRIRHTNGLKEITQINTKNPNELLFGITYFDSHNLAELELQEVSKVYGKTNKRIIYFTATQNYDLVFLFVRTVKALTNQYPSALIIEAPETDKENISKIFDLSMPIFITQKQKDEIKNIAKDL